MTSRLQECFDLLSDSGRVGNPSQPPDSDPTPGVVTSTPNRDTDVSGNLAPPRRPQVVIEDTTTSRSENQPMDAMVTLAQSLNGLLQQFTTQVEKLNSRKERPTRTFAGHVYENPVAFVRYMDGFFAENGIDEDLIKIDIFKNQLRDSARAWAQAFNGMPLTYRAFEESFFRQYNSSADKITAISQLYGEKQKINESVEVFLTKKRGLFARVNPDLEETAMADVLAEQLLPPIKARLRNQRFADILELIHQAVRAESDVQEEAAYWAKVNVAAPSRTQVAPPRSNPPANQGQPRPPTDARPPTPCRFCKRWHFHRDCPMNPFRTLNSRRDPEQRGQQPQTPTSSGARVNEMPRPRPSNEQPPRQRPNQVTVVAQVHHDAEPEPTATTSTTTSPTAH